VIAFGRQFGWLVLLLLFLSGGQAAENFSSAYISELLADNQRGMKDDDGERGPWIELHNGGLRAVSLTGWFLTDTPTNLTKWRFPPVGLLADKYLVVFASGKNRTNDPNQLHTNFRLAKNGGYLALVSPRTNVVSEFAPYPKHEPDVAHGRVRGEPTLASAQPKPTPGRANVSSGPGCAPDVTFSRPGGTFIEPFTLILSTRATDAVIRYTLDGTLPTTNSPPNTSPLLITNTVYVRARAYQPGHLPGPPASAAYIALITNAAGFTSTLPLLVLDTFGKHQAVSAQDTFVYLSVHEPVKGRASLTNAPALTTRAGFHVRGSTSSGFPQSPFSVELLDEFNDERDLPLLGLPAEADWVLYAPNNYDPIMIHNPFIYQLARDLGHYAPRTRFVEVFLTRSTGPLKETHYYGVYVLTEKIKISKHRINTARLDGRDLAAPKVTGGYVLKFDRVGPGESGMWGTGDRGITYVDPREEVLLLPQRRAQREYIESFMKEFTTALHGPNWQDPVKGYRAYLDVSAAIDFHVLEVLSGNVDAMVLSTYFYKPRGGKIVCGPHWDFDRALGSIDDRDAEPRKWITGPFFGGEWWPRLFSDPDFWQQWVDRWQELRETHFSLTNLNRLIDQMCGELREAQPREYQRWGLQPRGGSYEGEIAHTKNWLSNRVDFIDSELTPPPRLMRDGSRVTLAAARNATIYFTLDGTDPRLPQGAVAPQAVVYTNALELKPGANLVARARNTNRVQTGGPPVSTPWSRAVSSSR